MDLAVGYGIIVITCMKAALQTADRANLTTLEQRRKQGGMIEAYTTSIDKQQFFERAILYTTQPIRWAGTP